MRDSKKNMLRKEYVIVFPYLLVFSHAADDRQQRADISECLNQQGKLPAIARQNQLIRLCLELVLDESTLRVFKLVLHGVDWCEKGARLVEYGWCAIGIREYNSHLPNF
jgi:hypothetical protein